MKTKRLARTIIYQSKWVNLYVDQVQFPNGQIIEQHHLLDFERPAVIIVVEDEDERILMVRVCRYTTGNTAWELPAGGVEDGETPIEAAQREAMEETGYVCEDYAQLYTYYPMNGIANKQFHIFRCRAVRQAGEFDPDEISEIRWYSKGEIHQMIREQKIEDGPTLTAILLLGLEESEK